MAIVKLLEEEQYSELVRSLDRRVREYTRAPAMTPYVKATGHCPSLLAQLADEHAYVMPTRSLPRRLKEMLAVAVSMVNGCAYCITAHTQVLKRMFAMGDAELVELAATVAHVGALCRFETATMSAGHAPLFAPREPAEVPLLAEIEDALGRLPEYFRVMANDPGYLETVWSREKVTLQAGALARLDKEYVAFATAIATDAPYSVRLRREILTAMGESDEQLFEALEVVELFHKNTTFTEGLQLEPGLWADGSARG